jgi:hypothetical protein
MLIYEAIFAAGLTLILSYIGKTPTSGGKHRNIILKYSP